MHAQTVDTGRALWWLGVRLTETKSAVPTTFMISSMVSCTYPITILDAGISSFGNKVPHYFLIALFSCHVQRSPLKRIKSQCNRVILWQIPNVHRNLVEEYKILVNRKAVSTLHCDFQDKDKSAVLNLCTLYSIVLYSYPIIIFNVDISSFVNKVFHYVFMASSSCNMQGSWLMERNTVVTKVALNVFAIKFVMFAKQCTKTVDLLWCLGIRLKQTQITSTNLPSVVYSHTLTPPFSLMLILASLSTRYLTMSASSTPTATCRGVHWQREINKSIRFGFEVVFIIFTLYYEWIEIASDALKLDSQLAIW